MAGLLVALGGFMLAVAVVLFRDGSTYGLLIAWVFGIWGAMLVAWGLLAGWNRSIVACVAASAFALASVLVALLCVQFEMWEMAILCAVGSGLALWFGVYQVRFLVRQRGIKAE
jgi:hypothetical protein